jgi:hypothetical protein
MSLIIPAVVIIACAYAGSAVAGSQFASHPFTQR